MDELQALPYLDAVLRESLRLHGAVPEAGGRVARVLRRRFDVCEDERLE